MRLPRLALPRRERSQRAPGVTRSRPTLGGPKISLPKPKLSRPKREGGRRTLGGPKLSLPKPKLSRPKREGGRRTLGGPKLSLPKPKLSRPKLGGPKLSLPKPSFPRRSAGESRPRPQVRFRRPNITLPRLDAGTFRRSAGNADLVGLDIQPGFVAAVKASTNGSVVVERAVVLPLPADTVRDGEVLDEAVLGEVLKELFAGSGLSKRVRIGVANQRTVLRTLELPPITDPKELTAAVTFQAQDQVPMPLNNAVLDFQPLGVIDTPAGPRQRVVVVAAQKDMIERLLAAVRRAGLRPEGVDLSAFALIRALHRHDPEAERVLYLNVDGLTNLAIAEGTICRFTRVVGSGLEGMAVQVAERRGIALAEARDLVAAVDLRTPPAEPAPSYGQSAVATAPSTSFEKSPLSPETPDASRPDAPATDELAYSEPATSASATAPSASNVHGEDASFLETLADEASGEPQPAGDASADVCNVVEAAIRDISGEVRNSLDFHRSMDGGGEVSHVVLSGAADDIPGFSEALEVALGVPVRSQSVAIASGEIAERVSPHRLAVATGLATAEAPK